MGVATERSSQSLPAAPHPVQCGSAANIPVLLAHWIVPTPFRAMQKTSYPRQDIRVLLLEGVSKTAVDTFRDSGYTNIDMHAKSLPDDELDRKRLVEGKRVADRLDLGG